MRKNFTKIICLLLAGLAILSVVGCGATIDDSDAIKISFKSALSYDYLKSIDGRKVVINGYMATSSPVDGSSMFLMNLPYQSCPFCVPNTSQLSNTMKVYPMSGKRFGFTNQAIKVVGTLVVSPSVDQVFNDQYGYSFNFKIVDAQYAALSAEDLSVDINLWKRVADSGVVNDIYDMYEYVNFLCAWNTYSMKSSTNADGTVNPGFYLYPSDAKRLLTEEGAQFNYGYKDGYFEGIVRKLKSIDENAFDDLVANILSAKALSEKALKELNDGNYTSELKDLPEFGTRDYVYTLTNGDALINEMNSVYSEFTNWLGGWEM
ncbi:MAG: hypothetical protein J6B34_02160 [Clostridia bacterium]|nr:hypothetical protein [Clostridia bacterium]